MKEAVVISILVIVAMASMAQKKHGYISDFPTEKAPERYSVKVKRAIPSNGHPRVFVTADKISALRATYEFDSPKTNQMRQWLQQEAATTLDGISKNGKTNSEVSAGYEANAFLYLIYGDKVKGLKAKNMVLNYFRTLSDGEHVGPAGPSRQKMRAVMGAAMVYDWCYDLFSKEERKELIKEVIDQLKSTEFGWPFYPTDMKLDRFVGNHWAEGKPTQTLAFGIACYDENPEIYNIMADHFYDYLIPLRNHKNKGHRFEQGTGYSGRFTSEIQSTALFVGMGAENPYTLDQAKVPYYNMYLYRPDGIMMPEGDTGYMLPRGITIYMIAAKLYQDPVLMGQVYKYWDIIEGKEHKHNAALLFCFYDEKLIPASQKELPLTYYCPEPAGNMVARTSWETDINNRYSDSSSVIVKMDIQSSVWSGHTHADAGSFSIFYKAPLALDAGAYGNDPEEVKFGGTHFKNYLIKSVAHNSILIDDPEWKNFIGTNDRGQFIKTSWNTYKELEENALSGRVLAYGFGPDKIQPEYSYISGDVMPAYRSAEPGYPNKAKEVVRNFVFLNNKDEKTPGTFIVFDKVHARKKEFKKSWLLHSMNEPQINGSIQTIENKGGILVNHTLLPDEENAEYVVIGGKGREFEVNGINYPIQKESDLEKLEAGRWRIELSPKKQAETDLFLNVMEIKDATSPINAQISKIETTELVGAIVDNKVTLFPKSNKGIQTLTEFFLPEGLKKYKTLLTGIKSGSWIIEGPGIKEKIEVSKVEGTIYRTMNPGKYYLYPQKLDD